MSDTHENEIVDVKVELPDPDAGPNFENAERIEIFFNSRTKRLTGLGLLKIRGRLRTVDKRGAISVDERDAVMPCCEELGELLDRFVHDLCSLIEHND